MAANTGTRAVRHRVSADRVEGSDPVCPKCGAPLDFRTDPFGYGVTIEQCSRGVPACDHFRTLSTRVRPELARRPRGVETKRVRRSPGLAASARLKGPRRATKEASRQRLLVLLPIDAITAETPAELAARSRLSPGFVKCCLTDLKAEGKADYRVRHIPGKTGCPAHVWWRVA